jgi:hypothetical protein
MLALTVCLRWSADVKYPARSKPDTPASAVASKKRKGEALDGSEVKKSEAAPRKKIGAKRKRQESRSSNSLRLRPSSERTSAVEKALVKPMK